MTRARGSPPRRAADRYRSIFQRSAVSLWEEDISGLRALMPELTSRRDTDLRSHLRAHPALLRKGLEAIRVIDVNDATLELYEAKSKKDLLGPFPITLDPASLDDFVELIVAIDEGRTRMDLESGALTLTGRKLDLLVRSFIPREGDEYPYMLVNVIDITERKRLERTLEHERSVLRAVIDNVPDQIFVKDREGRFLAVNGPLAAAAGKSSPQEIVGKTDYDFFPSAFVDAYRADDVKIMASGKARANIEEKIVSSTGEPGWGLTTKVPLRNPDGEVTGIVGIIRDITERRKLEQRIEEEGSLLRTVIDNLPDAVFLKDRDGRFILANGPTAEIMNAEKPDDLIGKTDSDFYPRAMAREFVSDEKNLFQEGRRLVNKEEPKIVRGARRWLLTTKVPIADATGRITGLVGVSRDITSVKETQEALAGSEARYRTLVENLGVGIISADSAGKITFTNSTVGEIFGRPKGEARGRTIREFISGTAYARVAGEIARRRQDDKSSYEITITRPGGEERRVHLTAVSQFDQSGRYAGTFATLQDVTERYRAEQELNRQKALLQTLMDNVPDYIYFKDRDGRFVLTNRAMAGLLGLKEPAELLGKTDFDFFVPSSAAESRDDERLIMQTGRPLIDKIEMDVQPNRPPSWVSTTKMPLMDEKRQIVGTFGISRDMTERRQMEEKNLRLAAMIESSNDAIIGIDLAEKVTSWNTGAERIFGYSAAEMIGAPITPLLSPDIVSQRPIVREKLRHEGRPAQLESTVSTKDGREIHVSTSISYLKDAAGQIVGTTCICLDVTEQRALQVQVIRSQRLESLGTLAAGIAHQFNNINTAVRGYLDLVTRDAGLSPASLTYLREALKGVQRSVDITDRLQGLTSGATVGPEILHLEDAVPSLVSLFSRELEAERITLITDYQHSPPVMASHDALAFIVTSLMTNSVQALLDRPQRAITVRIHAELRYASLEVSDTGCGIPRENLSRIFTPFFTTKGEWATPGSSQGKVKGVGLSLAVCQSAVAENGGWIEVESAPDAGAVFRVWFPAAPPEAHS